MPSGTAPSEASALQGLQRPGSDLVAVCDEIGPRRGVRARAPNRWRVRERFQRVDRGMCSSRRALDKYARAREGEVPQHRRRMAALRAGRGQGRVRSAERTLDGGRQFHSLQRASLWEVLSANKEQRRRYECADWSRQGRVLEAEIASTIPRENRHQLGLTCLHVNHRP
jgi:hypothetical protein